MCGIVGIVAQESVAQTIYDALLVLQHRGQDAAGIVVCDGDRLDAAGPGNFFERQPDRCSHFASLI